ECRRRRLSEVETVELVERVAVDGEGKQLALDLAENTMLVRHPLRKAGKILEDRLAVGVEDVRPVAMDQHPGCVVLVVGVAANVIALVYNDDEMPRRGQSLGNDTAGEAGANDQDRHELSSEKQRIGNYVLKSPSRRYLLSIAFPASLTHPVTINRDSGAIEAATIFGARIATAEHPIAQHPKHKPKPVHLASDLLRNYLKSVSGTYMTFLRLPV